MHKHLTVKEIVKRFGVKRVKILRGYKTHKRLIVNEIVKRSLLKTVKNIMPSASSSGTHD